MQWTDPLVLRLHKPAGISSFDVIRKFKRILPKTIKKIGYFGTLDPFAEGLLLVALNQANRLTQFVHQDLNKTYIAYGVLGVETPTQDLTVDVTQKDESPYFQSVMSTFDLPFYSEQLKSFVGKYLQSPPAYSAAKFEGKKLCDWIRHDGIEIKKEQVLREIYGLDILSVEFPEIVFEVECSSGTYIRTLFVDMAHKIGTLGSLRKLLRSKIGKVSNNDQCTVENFFPELDEKNEHYLVPLTTLLPYPIISFNSNLLSDFKNGRVWELLNEKIEDGMIYWVQDENHKIFGLAKQENKKSKVLVGLH